MDWSLAMVAATAPGSGILQVRVREAGVEQAGVHLQLYNGPWLSRWEQPNEGVTGSKDEAQPGIVELVHVSPGNHLLGVEVQPGRWVYILLEMNAYGYWSLDVDLAAPRLTPGDANDEEADDGV